METNETTSSKPGQDAEQKRQWEENHKAIMECMHSYMQSNYKVPTVTFIAEKTGLSRNTVAKHMQNFTAIDAFDEHVAMFKLLSTSVLRSLYSNSMYGNISAARLYMQLMGVLKGGTLVENNFLSNALNPKELTPEEKSQKFLDGLTPSLKATLQDIIKERERREKEKEALSVLLEGETESSVHPVLQKSN
jgi:hypothetical protein